MAMVRNLLILLSFLLLVTACKKDKVPDIVPPEPQIIETEPVILTLKKKSLSAPFRGYYEGLPVHYSESNQRYPLLVFLHGIGQRGDGDGQLFTVGQDGLGKLLETRSLPPNFVVNGKNFSFIYICPQYWETPTGEDVKRLMDTLKAKYRIDISRIYLAGLSVGGIVTTEAAASYPYLYAAISAMGGTTASGLPGNFAAKCKGISDAKLPIWAFHNEFDPTIPRYQTEEFINKVKSYNPLVVPKYTLYLGSYDHNVWGRALNPATKEDGMNVYEWMLQYKR